MDSDRNREIVFLLVGAVVVLAVMGAGVLGYTLPAVILVLCLFSIVPVDRHDAGTDVVMSKLIAALLAFMLAMIIPFPPWFDWFIGQERMAQNAMARDAIGKAAESGLIDGFMPHFALSRNRAGTVRMILVVIAGLAAGGLAGRLRGKWRRRCLEALVLIGAVVAIGGYLSQWVVPQGKTIWWIFKVPHGRPVGCFVNRNHFGGFVAMLAPVAAVLAVDRLTGKKIFAGALWALCFVAMGVAVVMSHSRGAWLALAASMAFLMLAGLARKRLAVVAGSVLLLVGLAGAVMTVANDELEERFETTRDIASTSSAELRVNTWLAALRMVPDYPVGGVGPNAFRMVFPQYRTLTTRKSFSDAENEYVQIPAEFGLLGVLFIGGLLFRIGKRWWANTSGGDFDRSVDLAVAGAVVAVVTHAALDFAMRVPLYFVVLSILVGLVIHSPPDAERRYAVAAQAAFPILAIILVSLTILQRDRVFVMDSSDFLEKANPRELCTALEWSPTSWQTWYQLGRAAVLKGNPAFGEECITRATAYDPNNYRLWERLARLRLRLKDIEGAQRAYREVKALRSWVGIPELDAMEKKR